MSLTSSILCSMVLPLADARVDTSCMSKTRLARVEVSIEGFCLDCNEMVFEDGVPSCYLDERIVALTDRISGVDDVSSHCAKQGGRRADQSLGRKARWNGTRNAQGSKVMTNLEAIRESGLARLHLVVR